jgi:hypothetical protein
MEHLAPLDALSTAFTLFEKVSKVLREWTDKLPDTPTKYAAVIDLKQAEDAMEIAKVRLAESLGYFFCRKHFPPGIMLKIRDGVFSCQKCGDTPGSSSPPPTPA